MFGFFRDVRSSDERSYLRLKHSTPPHQVEQTTVMDLWQSCLILAGGKRAFLTPVDGTVHAEWTILFVAGSGILRALATAADVDF